MDYPEDIRTSLATALPAAALEGFSENLKLDSSVAEALFKGRIRMPGAKPISAACISVGAPSRGAIADLAALAPIWSGRATPVAVSRSALSEARQQAFREAGLAFVDAAGNAWIEAPGLVVDRRGMKAPARRGDQSSNAPAGIFSDKATIVARTLMDGRTLGIRELSAVAADAGTALSPGFVSKVARALEEKRYARRAHGKVRLVNRAELVQDWAEAYREMAHPRPRGWYLHAPDAEAARDAAGRAVGQSGAVAGLAAASLSGGYAMFDAVDVYARDLAAAEDSLAAAGAVRVERGANVNVMVPKYKASAFFGLKRQDGINITSDLQTYLDLQLQPRRGQEAAEHIMETRLLSLLADDAAERR